MAEISLRAYQDKIGELAAEERHDEVIAHARHILKLYPKNLRAYDQLADALMARARWAEAAQVLRRMLGADPQDVAVHTRLARACQQLNELEPAIWHAERALDQAPDDRAIANLLRALYREHRQEEIERLQLTVGAQAQRHIRGNLLAEALSTLEAALQQQPQRLDLDLLRARVLWLDGQRMDAAETANEILDQLPYALDANRIMTELWLAEQRPSDARRYLERIEALDPYLAHQLAAGQPAPDELRRLDELDYSSISSREQAIVLPAWLRERGGEDSGLGALFGIDEAPGDEQALADLADLLPDNLAETLLSQLVIGEAVQSTRPFQPDETNSSTQGATEDLVMAGAEASIVHEANLAQLEAQMAPADEPELSGEDANDELDDELANLLDQLNDELDDDADDGEWMAEIQQSSLDLDADDELEYVDDIDGERLATPEAGESSGAPWLSAAINEALEQADDDDLDLFSDDEQLQNLLKATSDTEPIDVSDIEDWLEDEAAPESSEADERFVDIDDELLLAPTGESWLEDGEESAAVEDDPNRVNADLIDSWQSELGDDDEDDDPYVDWLKDDLDELDDDLAILSAGSEGQTSAAEDAQEQARAWGLDDAEQLADFVEPASDAGTGAPDWMNAVVPGLDRENDATTDDVNEYARPMAPPGKEFAWVNEIVEEETGEMRAIEAAELDSEASAYFRFSKPPAWLVSLQVAAAGAAEGIVALSVDADIDSLELDDLTFDDYFSFDTPTDKMDVINLDEDTQELSFVGLDWDDYFDLESPTEKTIAISLDESAADIDFDPLGLDDEDFSFVKDQDASAQAAPGTSDMFDDIGLGSEAESDDAPLWLKYDSSDGETDLPNRRSPDSSL